MIRLIWLLESFEITFCQAGAFEMCPQLAGVTGNRFLVTFARFGTTNTRVFDRHTESLYNNT